MTFFRHFSPFFEITGSIFYMLCKTYRLKKAYWKKRTEENLSLRALNRSSERSWDPETLTTEDSKEEPIIVDPKEDPISKDPREDPKEEPVAE